MDPGSIVYVLALLIGAAVVVLILLRIMRARGRAVGKAVAPPAAPAPPEDDEYLDSSHILPGGADAAARAAEALRQAKGKRK